jgi:hypothetical protein
MIYRAFGLEIACDAPLAGVPLAETATRHDVLVRVGTVPDRGSRTIFFRTENQNADHSDVLRVSRTCDGSFHFAYGDGTSFLVDSTGSEVWMNWPEAFTLEDACTYLLGPILGFLLRLRGVISLHASGVMIGDAAVAFVGAAGAGKSTTAAMFANLGYPIITDDVFVLRDCRGRFLVEPGYATLRLWPESVAALYGSGDALPLITPNWDKRYLDLRGTDRQFAAGPVSIAAVYVLGDRQSGVDAPFIGPEPEPFITLLSNTYCSYLLDRSARAHEFDVLSRFTDSTVVRRITPHTDLARLPELCRTIVSDVQCRLPVVS